MSHAATVQPPSSSPCRTMLRAIHSALALPYPATVADELPSCALRWQRAGLVLEAVERVLRDRGAYLLGQAEFLTEQLAGYPAGTCTHNPVQS